MLNLTLTLYSKRIYSLKGVSALGKISPLFPAKIAKTSIKMYYCIKPTLLVRYKHVLTLSQTSPGFYVSAVQVF